MALTSAVKAKGRNQKKARLVNHQRLIPFPDTLCCVKCIGESDCEPVSEGGGLRVLSRLLGARDTVSSCCARRRCRVKQDR